MNEIILCLILLDKSLWESTWEDPRLVEPTILRVCVAFPFIKKGLSRDEAKRILGLGDMDETSEVSKGVFVASYPVWPGLWLTLVLYPEVERTDHPKGTLFTPDDYKSTLKRTYISHFLPWRLR